MSFEVGQVVLAVVFFVLGWLGNTAWDWLCEVVADTTGFLGSLFGSLLAMVGAVAIAVGIGYIVTR